MIHLGRLRHPSLFHYSALVVGKCGPSGHLHGKEGHCNPDHDSDCCMAGKMYPQYRCSPLVNGQTQAHMTINGFSEGDDGGGPSEYDNSYHNDNEMVVALSTGWYNHGSRCLKNIRIDANGKSVLA